MLQTVVIDLCIILGLGTSTLHCYNSNSLIDRSLILV